MQRSVPPLSCRPTRLGLRADQHETPGMAGFGPHPTAFWWKSKHIQHCPAHSWGVAYVLEVWHLPHCSLGSGAKLLGLDAGLAVSIGGRWIGRFQVRTAFSELSGMVFFKPSAGALPKNYKGASELGINESLPNGWLAQGRPEHKLAPLLRGQVSCGEVGGWDTRSSWGSCGGIEWFLALALQWWSLVGSRRSRESCWVGAEIPTQVFQTFFPCLLPGEEIVASHAKAP